MLDYLSVHQQQYICLWYLVQHSLPSFYKIKNHFQDLEHALSSKSIAQWQKLAIHKNHITRLQQLSSQKSQQHLAHIFERVQQHCDFILTEDEMNYPRQLFSLSDRPPIIFGQGQAQALLHAQIAVVGSRHASPHGRQITYDFAYYLSEQGFYITSGLAQGIDSAAHQAGLKNQRSIAVLGTGIAQTYPHQNMQLRQQICQNNGAVISEFLPDSKALAQHFPRRNRIVSGLSLAVLITEAKLNSGSLITAKWAAEQGRSIFAIPGHIYHESSHGCHQLIREGAILVDHPEQIIEDLALATQWHYQNTAPILVEPSCNIAKHLIKTYQQLDWIGQSLDQLALQLNLDIATLTSNLIELELLGLAMQQSGLYLRCRSHQ